MTKYGAPLTSADAERLGDAVGRIVALTARSLAESFPHLSVERLTELFTRPLVLEVTASRYLAALEAGQTAGEAAGQAGTALIRDWANARLKAREEATTPRL
ncbi:hypothetical protein [Streptomyces longispororuber]|uniref:hypothetical protein n=1 Tax=Streptomyces longispororuber TaxID=68230 RepID=UPI0036F753C0